MSPLCKVQNETTTGGGTTALITSSGAATTSAVTSSVTGVMTTGSSPIKKNQGKYFEQFSSASIENI